MEHIRGQLFRATPSLVTYSRDFFFFTFRALVVCLETQVLLADRVNWYVIRTHSLMCNCLVLFCIVSWIRLDLEEVNNSNG